MTIANTRIVRKVYCRVHNSPQRIFIVRMNLVHTPNLYVISILISYSHLPRSLFFSSFSAKMSKSSSYTPTYAYIFHVVSSFQVSQLKCCNHLRLFTMYYLHYSANLLWQAMRVKKYSSTHSYPPYCMEVSVSFVPPSLNPLSYTADKLLVERLGTHWSLLNQHECHRRANCVPRSDMNKL